MGLGSPALVVTAPPHCPADMVETNRPIADQHVLRVAEDAMDAVRERLGDERVDAYVERLENNRDLGAFVSAVGPKRVAILVDRLPGPTTDPEYVVAVAVHGTIETAYLRRIRPEDLQARNLDADDLWSLGFGDVPEPPRRLAKVAAYGFLLVLGAGMLLFLYDVGGGPGAPVALVIVTAVIAVTSDWIDRIDRMPTRRLRWTLLHHALGAMFVLAILAAIAIAAWAFVRSCVQTGGFAH
jgi:hypothetical protein